MRGPRIADGADTAAAWQTSASSAQPTSYDDGRVTEDFVTDQYTDLFDGRLGLLEGDVHLETDPSVPPV